MVSKNHWFSCVFAATVLLLDPEAMGDKGQENDDDFWAQWAQEETESWEVREQVNKHLQDRKANKSLEKVELEKKEEDQSCFAFVV